MRDTVRADHYDRDDFWDDDDDYYDDEDIDPIEERLFDTYNKQELKTARKSWKLLARRQQEDSIDICSLLIFALSSLPNVQRLELIDKKGVYGMETGPKEIELYHSPLSACSPWKDMLIDPKCYYSTIQDDWSAEEKPPKPNNPTSAWALHYIGEALALYCEQSTSPKPFSAITKVTLNLNHHIPVARLFSNPNRSFKSCKLCEMYESGTPSSKLKSLCRLFETLTRINLQMPDRQLDQAETVLREVARALGQARKVRHLELNMAYANGCILFAELPLLSPDDLWRHLEYLRFSGAIKMLDLSKLLRVTAKSLRHLELYETLILEENYKGVRWDDFLQSIRPVLTLERANLSRLRDESTLSMFSRMLFPDDRVKSEMNAAVEH